MNPNCTLKGQNPLERGRVSIGGIWGQSLVNSCKNWTLLVDEDVLLDGFRNKPVIQPWIGEHAGKWLLGSIGADYYLKSKELADKINRIAQGLINAQESGVLNLLHFYDISLPIF